MSAVVATAVVVLLFSAQVVHATSQNLDDASDPDGSGTANVTVAYVGMSASIFLDPVLFDPAVFQSELALAANIDADRLFIVTFYPSSNDSLTIVDFVVLDKAESSAVSLATKLLTTSLDSMPTMRVLNMISDPTVVYQPGNATVIIGGDRDGDSYSVRDPGITPEVIMWLLTAFWIAFCAAFLWHYFHRVVKDQSLYYSPFPPLEGGGVRGAVLLGAYEPPTPFHLESDAGSCDAKQLDDATAPVPLNGFELDEPLGCIAVGTGHVCFTTCKGVFVWGDNKWGQLGLGSITSKWTTAASYFEVGSNRGGDLFVYLDERVDVPCRRHSGRSDNDDLGMGHGWELTANNKKFICLAVRHWHLEDAIGGVVDVACGSMHTVWLTGEGVFVCGSNAQGQLGLPPSAFFANHIVPVPQHLDMAPYTDAPVTSVAAGSFHSAVLDSSGAVFVFGLSHDGQLLDGNFDKGGGGPLMHRVNLSALSLRATGVTTSFSVEESCEGATPLAVRDVECFGAHTVLHLTNGSVIYNHQFSHTHEGGAHTSSHQSRSLVTTTMHPVFLWSARVGEGMLMCYRTANETRSSTGVSSPFMLIRVSGGLVECVKTATEAPSLVESVVAELMRSDSSLQPSLSGIISRVVSIAESGKVSGNTSAASIHVVVIPPAPGGLLNGWLAVERPPKYAAQLQQHEQPGTSCYFESVMSEEELNS